MGLGRLLTVICILSMLGGSLSHNTLSILACRATNCFEDYYACHSKPDCFAAYNKLNTCM